TYLLLSNTRLTLSAAVAVLRALARSEECFPCDARRIVGPGLFRLRIAAGSLSLFDDVAACAAHTRVDFLQFVLALDLDTEMIRPRPLAARRDRKIHARIIEHPFGIVRLHHRGLGGEQRRIESDRILEIFDSDMNMHAFHGMDSLYRGQRLVSDPLHHGFKVLPDLVREPKPFDDGSRSKQWQDANIVETCAPGGDHAVALGVDIGGRGLGCRNRGWRSARRRPDDTFVHVRWKRRDEI